MELLVIFVVVLILFIVLKIFKRRHENFPPGPRGLPFLGNLNLFSADIPINQTLQTLAKKYGSVTGLFLGPTQPFISVSGLEAIRETLLNDDLNSRPTGPIFNTRSFGESLGLIFTSGPLWQEQRRFTLRHLRDLGFGKTSIEDQMMEVIVELIEEIKESSRSDPNGRVEFKSMFSVPVINILWAILAGQRLERDTVAFKRLVLDINEVNRTANIGLILAPVPAFLVRQFPIIAKWLGMPIDLFKRLQSFIQDNIDQHLTTRSAEGDEAPRDFIDVYLDEMKEHSKKYKTTTFKHNQLVTTVLDLFGAGADTSSNTIGFAILYLVRYPEIQRRIQTELDNVCGDALPSLSHRPNLPYTEAFIMEVARVSNVVPISVPHCAAKDTTIGGFHIPKGSLVVTNFESIFQDEAIWKDPKNFWPERHLNADGRVVRNVALIPFGLGKRSCLGEPLARNTIFLFVTALAKTFEFKQVDGQQPPSLEPEFGFTLAPKPFRAKVLRR